MKRKPAASNATRSAKPIEASVVPERRPPQFPIGGLLGLMVVVGIATAPAFYMIRGAQGEPGSQLAGMLMILAGPLLLVIVVSSFLQILQWWNRR